MSASRRLNKTNLVPLQILIALPSDTEKQHCLEPPLVPCMKYVNTTVQTFPARILDTCKYICLTDAEMC